MADQPSSAQGETAQIKGNVAKWVERGKGWPVAVSDGLTLPCADCGEVPRFDYRVAPEFWRRWVPDKPERLGVVCLSCLDRRCGGEGLANALLEVQWTGTGHTVVLVPERRYRYDVLRGSTESPIAFYYEGAMRAANGAEDLVDLKHDDCQNIIELVELRRANGR